MAIADARAISGALLSAVMALFPDAAVTADSEGLIVSVNERAEQLFGYEPGSLAGVSIETLVPERVRLRHRDHRASYLAHPQTRAMGAGLELTGRRRDGSEFPLDISLAPIMNEGEQLVVAAIRDVTEQRQATVAQAELATIVSSSLDAIIATSVDGHITNWNPAAEVLLGYTREEILGEHISTLVPEQASIVLEELLDNGTSGEQPGAQDTCWRHRDGEEVEVSVSMSPLRDNSGSLCGYSAIARVSGRKATERELLRLLEEETRLQHAHATSSEIRRTLLASPSLHESLVLICSWASALLDAPVAIVSVVEAGDLHIEAAVGAASGMMGMTLPTGQSLAEAAGNESAELARRGESSTDPASGPFPEGPRLDVPIVVDGEQMASLDFVREIGSEGYSPSARRLAETLAEQASLAFEQERLRQDNNETALVDDRERIGRDLHDHVVQRLFAAGLGLQSSLSQINDPTIQEKVSRTIDMLDETIDDIRTAIFGLSPPTDASPRLRAQILEVAEDSAVALGFHPSLTFEGAVDNDVPETLVPEVLACVREMLSNVAHHAEATSARVSLALHDGFLVITASDDGAGIGTGTTRSSGLGNLSERARLLGGSFDISSSPTGGTQLDWRVPVDT